MILFRSVLRDLQRHRWQTLLSILGIALGVAVVLAVDIANYSADRAMQWSQRALAPGITHQVVPGPSGLPEDFYVRLRKELGIRNAIPVVAGTIQVSGSDARWQLLGVDVLAGTDVLPRRNSADDQENVVLQLISIPGTVVMLPGSAKLLGVSKGKSFTIRNNNKQHQLRIVGTAVPPDPIRASALARVVITDIATAQEILELNGRLSRVDLQLADDTKLLASIRDLLPPNAQLLTNTQRDDALAQMTDAFQINLTALSLLALLLGAFLIFNTMTLSVLRRRRSIAILRALGVRRGELLLIVLGEAGFLGTIGTALGLLLGIWLSHGLLSLVTRTINDLYFSIEIQSITFGSLPVIKSAALGIGASLAATLVPAVEALRTPPGPGLSRATVEIKARRQTWHGLIAAALCAVATIVLLWWSERSLVLGFVALFTLILTFAFSAPAGLLWIVRFVRPVLSRTVGMYGAMATRGITASLSRTQVAVAALALAVATSIAVTIMIDSFRSTVGDWLHYYLRADVYIARDASQVKGIDLSLVHRLRHQPEVAAVHTGRWIQLTGAAPTTLFAIDVDKRGFDAYRLTKVASNNVWPAFSEKDAVIVSEPFAYHRDLQIGDKVNLATEQGRHDFKIVAVFQDYGSDRGIVVMHHNTYQRFWRDDTVTSVAVYLQNPQDSMRFVDQWREVLQEKGARIRSNHTLRELSLSIFDRTFVVTGVLRLLAIIIAVIGIFSALLAIQLERGREVAVLRALGLTPGNLRRLLTTESGILGFSAGLLALPLAVSMAWGLIHIINRRAFGWSLNMDLSLTTLLGGMLLAIVAAIAAGWYPAYRMARSAPVENLRYE